MSRTAAYVRVSSDKSDVTRQHNNIGILAEQLGEAPVWFEDSEGRNPRHKAAKRQGFQALLKAVAAGKFDRVIVDSQDRFGTKDAYEWGKFVSHLREHDCELLDSTGKILSADDDASVLTGVVGALTSKREQREKAHRNISGKVAYAKQGEYQGGYPPHGMDVVCFGPDGREKWRSVYIGHHDRLKVYPDGREERFTGKNVTPAKDATDSLRLRPSREVNRLKTVKQVFDWYASEDTSPGRIADRLNELGVSPVFSEAWSKHTIRAMLMNPIYLGFPTWNKRAGSEFVEYVGGQLREVTAKAGGRKRKPADYVQPDKPEFQAIVDTDTFNTVQRKLVQASLKGKRRSARCPELWLGPFLVCGQCGKRMNGSKGEGTQRLQPSYLCANYNRYGKNNPTKCHCHRVRHSVIEKLVMKYLTDTAPKIAKLMKAAETGDVEGIQGMLANGSRSLHREFADYACELITYVEENGTKREKAKVEKGMGYDDVFGLVYERLRPSLEKQIEAKDAELDELMKAYAGLPKRLQPRAAKQMQPLHDELEQLKGRLFDLRQPFHNVRADLQARQKAIAKAKREIGREGANRKKAEALRGAVDHIALYFRHTEGEKNNGRSYLERAVIFPVTGDSTCLAIEGSPGRDFVCQALAVEYGPDVMKAIFGEPWKDSIRKASAAAQETYRKRRETKP